MGHEIGLHAWDHHGWQSRLDRMSAAKIGRELERGVALLKNILGKPSLCSAVPAWKCNGTVLLQKEKYPFQFNSDCRGWSVFLPVVAGIAGLQPQIPTTLPTYDEAIGSHGITEANYNDYLLGLIKPGQLNVLTVHAEVEGMSCVKIFDLFLQSATLKGIKFTPLGDLIKDAKIQEYGRIVRGTTPGRDGWIACQRRLSDAKKEIMLK
jgi:undecaprenyl phosphate-alpha-L-ara4FN deformylase